MQHRLRGVFRMHSAVYVLNDLFDVEADRHHPTKRNRPIASGTLPIHYAPWLACGLFSAGIALALLTLPPAFAGLLCLYMVVNCLYSFWLKRKLVLDVMLLAGMYALRVIVGGMAVGIIVSEWLAAFSIFFFTSLAFAKRHSELARISEEASGFPRSRVCGRRPEHD